MSRAEGRALAALAAPIALVQCGRMLLGVVDTLMVGRVGDAELAAVAVGNAVTFSTQFLGTAVLFALATLISQAHGAGDRHRVAAYLQQGPVLGVLMCLPIGLVLWNAEPILDLLNQQDEVRPIAAAYIRGMVPGILGIMLFAAVRQGVQGLGFARSILAAVIVGNLVNVLANWILIFGNMGLPAYGAAGSAYASSISNWAMFAVLLWASRPILAPHWQGFDSRAFRLNDHLRILRVGVPISVQVNLELWVFTTVAILMGTLGVAEQAGHQVALTLASLTFQIPLSIGMAATTRVGNAVGRDDPDGARTVARLAFVYGTAVMALSAAGFALFPRPLAALFTPEETVIDMAATLLPIAALFQLFDGAQAVGSGILRGIADTRVPAVMALVCYWIIGLPFGWHLAVGRDWGAEGLWYGLTLGLFLASVLYGRRILRRFSVPIERFE